MTEAIAAKWRQAVNSRDMGCVRILMSSDNDSTIEFGVFNTINGKGWSWQVPKDQDLDALIPQIADLAAVAIAKGYADTPQIDHCKVKPVRKRHVR